jgi:LmbE family N-acetylglucosaminyl deacetylase
MLGASQWSLLILTHTKSGRDVLFVLAHQDDEYFALPWICEEVGSGSRIAIVFLTNGGLRTDPQVRNNESLRALQTIGVEESRIEFLGTAAEVPDGRLIYHLTDSYNGVRNWISKLAFSPVCIYAPDWEGGHPDHDAAYVIALRLAEDLNIKGWGFSLYNAFKAPKRFFRVLNPLPNTSYKTVVYSTITALKYAAFCWRYTSQWKTWIGLFPESFVKRIFWRRETVNALDRTRLQGPPHHGELLYERMFGTTYGLVSQHANDFMSVMSP